MMCVHRSLLVIILFSVLLGLLEERKVCVESKKNIAESVGDIFDEFWQWRLVNAPEFATASGFYMYDDRLDEMSLSSYLRRLDEAKMFLERVKAMRQQYTSTKRSDLELLESQLAEYISGQEYKSFLWPMNNLEGPHIDFPRLLSWMKKDTKEDMLKIVMRMRLFRRQIDESIALMIEGIRLGLTMHSTSIESLPEVLEAMATEAVEKSPIYKPFLKRPKGVNESDWKELLAEVNRTMEDVVQPSYLRLSRFIKNEYLAHTRPHIGASTLPNGGDYYVACLRYHTSTNLTAKEIHDIGLKEVHRITGRMEKVKEATQFKGSLKEFRRYLRTDPKFNYSTGEEIINLYKQNGQRNHKLLPKYFSVLPKAPYAIVPVPPEVAPSFPGAFYLAPPQDGSRPGTFYINTYKPETRKRYSAVSLGLHEAEPGHHLQNTLAIENGSPLSFRRFAEDRKYYEAPASFPKYTAYTEGWGLYSEFLGEEMGVFSDPYDMFGRLSDEMLRACRLVVDTGMHALGWSKERARNFMQSNTALGMQDIGAEVNRYITWPGQACGYKIGELKIKQMREKAEMVLKEKFDAREFHTMIASLGGVPLDFLEEQVNKFIREQSRRGRI